MILKMQRPIAPPDAPVLAYDERRSVHVLIDQSPRLGRLFGDRLKIYVTAHIAENGALEVDKVVPDRNW